MIRKIIVMKLNWAAKILLWRKKPEIIAITGSAGKTTTKHLLAKILSSEFEVKFSEEGYNTEIGAPLMLFNEKSPQDTKSIFAWTRVIFRCFVKAFFLRDYPEKVIMEFGADAPGDIEYLCKIFKPHKGIVLTVLPVHMENFKNIESIAKEKGELAKGVREGGYVFLNADNKYTKEMAIAKGTKRVTFGKNKDATYLVSNIKSDLNGLAFDLQEGGDKARIKARLYGEQMIYPLISAIAVARKDHLSYKKIQSVLKGVAPFPGRMNVIEGINGSVIIDDSYNSSPEAALMALDFLSRQKGRRIALLGSMNELGDYEKEAHEIVGEKTALTADILITVGDAAEKYLSTQAKRKGMSKEHVISFKSSVEAGEYLKNILKDGDIVLAKGSQNKVRVEKAVEIIMKDKNRKSELLARQTEFWKNR